ncbi:MAG: signal recognition particle-docking protein FtsY [Synergistales bacterium]|nr:signal recognition particle-docking protein FtsY [Synergistaceae bacterium]MDD4612480.1 signal recognition particle-docking protein FtsY [Synergistaceae bacterium]NCC55990.1 signal recognition particle-docking protein FtsY [Synergistales bacterium]NLO57178.1 signal recognition particle-docking protein FtsY [Synergistaceae bacterium]
MAFFEKLKQGLRGVRERWSGGLSSLFSGTSIDGEFWDRLEEILISGDVGVDLSLELIDMLKKETAEKKLKTPESLFGIFEEKLRARLSSVQSMGEAVQLCEGELTIVILAGVNGSGKTTTAGKMAARWKKEGKKVFFAAADTFRAAAIEQLKVWGDRSGVRVIAQKQGSDAAAVAFDALQASRAAAADVLIVDTAGRLHSKHNLMEELGKIYRTLEKEKGNARIEVLLVLDAVMGQNGLAQAQTFNKVLPLSGIVLTKYDNTAKGGILLAIADTLKIPVRYVGLGEGEDDLREFDVKEFISALLGAENKDGQ